MTGSILVDEAIAMKPSTKKHFNDSTNSQMDIFILTIAQKSLCSVKGVAGSEEPTRNYHLNLQFTTSLLQSFLVSFSSLFWLMAWFTSSAFIM